MLQLVELQGTDGLTALPILLRVDFPDLLFRWVERSGLWHIYNFYTKQTEELDTAARLYLIVGFVVNKLLDNVVEETRHSVILHPGGEDRQLGRNTPIPGDLVS